MARDAAAARAALPRAEADYLTANEAVRAAHLARDAALHTVAGEAVHGLLVAITAKRCEALAIEAKILGLQDELMRRGHAGAPVAHGAAARLRGALKHARDDVAVPRNDEAGARLLAVLVADPTAELE